MAHLEARNVSVRFGGKAALHQTTVTVDRGAVTGLIGPNGAGKTTLFNVVCGLLRPNAGEVVLDGEHITGAPPHRRARHGLARTFQRLELFTSLSVRDNMRRGADASAETERVIELCGLGAIADRAVSEIPTGQARVVELARALMTKPSALLLDEPAAGQTEAETVAFGRLLRQLAGDGLAICLVEHDMSLVMDVCETIHVLDYGRTIAVGTPEAVRADPAVVEAYLGTPEGVG